MADSLQPKLYWIVSGWTTNEQGEKAEFDKHYFDTRQHALLYILEKFRDNGFSPHCEWTEWTNRGKGVEERECLLCPKVEVRVPRYRLDLPQSLTAIAIILYSCGISDSRSIPFRVLSALTVSRGIALTLRPEPQGHNSFRISLIGF